MAEHLSPGEMYRFHALQSWRRIIGDLSLLKNKRILDLGCGGIQNPDSAQFDSLPSEAVLPWMLRAAAAQGAGCYGIDLASQASDDVGVYTHLQADLTEVMSSPDTFSTWWQSLTGWSPVELPFDIIYSRFLLDRHYGSNTLLHMLHSGSSRVQYNERTNARLIAFVTEIENTAGSVLADEGIIFLE